MPYISIIICTYNREKYIKGLLNSLKKQEYPKKDYEIVFVNNNSDDETDKRCTEFQDANSDVVFHYFNETKQGLSHARNRGVLEAKGEILAFIDDDALAHANYLQNMSKAFKENDVDAAGGKIYPKYESKRPEWMSKFLEPVMSVIDLGDRNRIFPKNKFPIGANMIFRKEVFEHTGNFNTELGRTGKKMLGGEEKDLFYRMKTKNMSIHYLHDVVISHIIPDERLTDDFIEKQAAGIGKSEIIRAKNFSHINIFAVYFKELLKWSATILLAVFYATKFQFSKSKMLIKFRYRVSKGMLGK